MPAEALENVDADRLRATVVRQQRPDADAQKARATVVAAEHDVPHAISSIDLNHFYATIIPKTASVLHLAAMPPKISATFTLLRGLWYNAAKI